MADDKELIRKDLAIILKLDSQIDYSQKMTVEKYYKDIMAKGLLTTPLGQRYMRRLEQIIDGEASYNKCLFCNSQTQGNTVICPACTDKFKKPSVVYCRSCGNKMNSDDMICPVCGKNKEEGYKYCAHCGKAVPMPDIEAFTNNAKNKSREIAEQAARIARENVQTIAEKGSKLAEDIITDKKRAKKDNTETKKERKGLNKKSILIWIAVLLTAVVIAGTIGFDIVFAFLALVSLTALIYKGVKKKPKKSAAIAFVVFLLLSGIAGSLSGSSGVPDNILDYIGTKESVVYQTYDKNDFYVEPIFGDWIENQERNRSGLPHILISNGIVRSVVLESGMNASFNVKGLHIGDNVSQVEASMKKLKAVKEGDDVFLNGNRMLMYSSQYKGKNMTIMINVVGNIVDRINININDN